MRSLLFLVIAVLMLPVVFLVFSTPDPIMASAAGSVDFEPALSPIYLLIALMFVFFFGAGKRIFALRRME